MHEMILTGERLREKDERGDLAVGRGKLSGAGWRRRRSAVGPLGRRGKLCMRGKLWGLASECRQPENLPRNGVNPRGLAAACCRDLLVQLRIVDTLVAPLGAEGALENAERPLDGRIGFFCLGRWTSRCRSCAWLAKSLAARRATLSRTSSVVRCREPGRAPRCAVPAVVCVCVCLQTRWCVAAATVTAALPSALSVAFPYGAAQVPDFIASDVDIEARRSAARTRLRPTNKLLSAST